jgi:DNA-binding PadR family transcriptional regulator
LVESRWEDPQLAADDGRPRRRLYHVTALGERAALEAPEERTATSQLRTGTVEP